MTKMVNNAVHEVPTTNITIQIDKIDVFALSARFQLFSMELPEKLRFKASKNKLVYAFLHNEYKEQLDLPYYFHPHSKGKPMLYLLKEIALSDDSFAPELNLAFLECTVKAKPLNISTFCTETHLTILVKLFFAHFFYNSRNKYRICQGFFYLSSKFDKFKMTALKVRLSSSKHTKAYQIEQESAYLLKIDKSESVHKGDLYVEAKPDEPYCRQIKQSVVTQWLADEADISNLYKVVSKQDRNRFPTLRNPSIPWYSDIDFSNCKTKLLNDLQDEVVIHFNETFGEGCAQKQSHQMAKVATWKPYKAAGFNKDTGLYLKRLEKVGIYDNRFQEIEAINAISIEQYVAFFNYHYSKKYNIEFVHLTEEDLVVQKHPVLVLQDAEAEVFLEGGFLKDYDDPKNTFYQQWSKQIAIQTLNVNINEDSITHWEQNDKLTRETDFYKKRLENSMSKIEHEKDAALVKKIEQDLKIYQEKLSNLDQALEKVQLSHKSIYFKYDMIGERLKWMGNSFEQIDKTLKEKVQDLKNRAKQEQAQFGAISEETTKGKKHIEDFKNYYSLISNKIDVCLNDLLLKYYLIALLPVDGTDRYAKADALPCMVDKPKLKRYAYMYGNFLMYIDDHKKLKFIDLHEREGKEMRNEYLKKLDINWVVIEKDFERRNFTNAKETEYDAENERLINKHNNLLRDTHFVFSKGIVLAIEDTKERVLFKSAATEKKESQRLVNSKTALEHVFYAEREQIYTVGYISLNQTAEDSVAIRKLHFYQKTADFDMQALLQTLTVKFVRNQQYTVYPYFFDLLNLYRYDILRCAK
jgi:hypothetical protein